MEGEKGEEREHGEARLVEWCFPGLKLKRQGKGEGEGKRGRGRGGRDREKEVGGKGRWGRGEMGRKGKRTKKLIRKCINSE